MLSGAKWPTPKPSSGLVGVISATGASSSCSVRDVESEDHMATFDKADIARLMDGVLPWPAGQDMMKSPKDLDRFDMYVQILSERVDWDARILLPLTPVLFVVAKDGSRIVKCRG